MLPSQYSHTLDPFVALSSAAAVTERIKLGTGVCLVIERDPIVTAKEVASLDRLSGGRFLFGVGAGWNREEMRNHGTDPQAALLGHARAGRGDEGDLDEGRGRVPRRVRGLRPDLVLAQAHAEAAPAGAAGRRRARRCSTACSPTPTSGRRTGSAAPRSCGAHRGAARASRAPRARRRLRRQARRASSSGGSSRPGADGCTLYVSPDADGRRPSASSTSSRRFLMARLDELDLSLKLSKEEEAERLEAGWKRLGALRLALGAKLPGYGLGPPLLRPVRGLGRVRQGRRDQAARLAARPAPRARGAVRRADAGRAAPPLPVALLAAAARAGAAWPCFDRTWYGRVLVERVEGFAKPRAVEARVRRDRRASSACSPPRAW